MFLFFFSFPAGELPCQILRSQRDRLIGILMLSGETLSPAYLGNLGFCFVGLRGQGRCEQTSEKTWPKTINNAVRGVGLCEGAGSEPRLNEALFGHGSGSLADSAGVSGPVALPCSSSR